ncbi:hypothetical protein CEXT_574501 [Caerostris extrusa]|uniref:Uncharacterized protein n=1 Tax=Caerostris extrusa TaxID=172846 RepID=A0AAV4PGJ1_CAEEX|nr:hypothetical protein CEXT_574501 [Caerostris extrusa]
MVSKRPIVVDSIFELCCKEKDEEYTCHELEVNHLIVENEDLDFDRIKSLRLLEIIGINSGSSLTIPRRCSKSAPHDLPLQFRDEALPLQSRDDALQIPRRGSSQIDLPQFRDSLFPPRRDSSQFRDDNPATMLTSAPHDLPLQSRDDLPLQSRDEALPYNPRDEPLPLQSRDEAQRQMIVPYNPATRLLPQSRDDAQSAP